MHPQKQEVVQQLQVKEDFNSLIVTFSSIILIPMPVHLLQEMPLHKGSSSNILLSLANLKKGCISNLETQVIRLTHFFLLVRIKAGTKMEKIAPAKKLMLNQLLLQQLEPEGILVDHQQQGDLVLLLEAREVHLLVATPEPLQEDLEALLVPLEDQQEEDLLLLLMKVQLFQLNVKLLLVMVRNRNVMLQISALAQRKLLMEEDKLKNVKLMVIPLPFWHQTWLRK